MTAVLELAPRTLPRQVKPFSGEILSSYLERLANANRLDPQALRRYIAEGQQSGNVQAHRLATVSGVPTVALEHAIANLDGFPLARTYYYRTIAIHPQVSAGACQMCAAARGITQLVICWKPAERVICLRHRRWTGSDKNGLQPSLNCQPDIIRAHTQHLRLVRRFGRDEVTMGFEIAAEICRQWRDEREHDEEFSRRLAIFHGPNWRLSPSDPTVAAAAYPEVVGLARLLISPYWRSLAVAYSSHDLSLFQQEMRRTVAPAYRWPQPSFSKDPLHRWIIGGHRRSAYDDASSNDHQDSQWPES
jgi:TniQ